MTAGWWVVPARVLRHPRWDALAVSLSIAHGAALVAAPSMPLIAIGMWWNANTLAHQFIHRPFFRVRSLNRLYSAYSSLLIGIPQSLWRVRHLDHHHAGEHGTTNAQRRPVRYRRRDIAVESALVVTLWSAIASVNAPFFLTTYLPGWAVGLTLCHLHGYYEHARGTTSHYGWLYNLLLFNDGYHVEHHARPGEHWSHLSRQRQGPRGSASRWPPVLRWLDACSLTGLERLVLAWPWLQRVVLHAHARAFARLAPGLGAVDHALVVGGGLFPRTPLVLRALYPRARITVIDASADHVARARPFLGDDVAWRAETYTPARSHDADLIVVPLAYVGARSRFYADPPAPIVLVHDWIWHRRGDSAVVAWWLLKRVNVVRRAARGTCAGSPAA